MADTVTVDGRTLAVRAEFPQGDGTILYFTNDVTHKSVILECLHPNVEGHDTGNRFYPRVTEYWVCVDCREVIHG